MSAEDRKAASKSISRSCREDYRAYVDGIINDMETAERTGNKREVTRLVKLLNGKANTAAAMPSKDLTGKPIMSVDQLLTAWNEFLSKKFAAPDIDANCP